MNYYLYILKMLDGRLYTGITDHLDRREAEHGLKSSTRTTYIFGAGELIYSESHPDRTSAHKRECQIKKWSHAKKIALANGNFKLLKDLSKKDSKFETSKVRNHSMSPKFFLLFLLLGGLLLPACAPTKASLKADSISSASPMVSDTLYFGTSTDKGPVTDPEWNSFLNSVVTPRFPEGLTVWDAKGQWRSKNGRVGKEKTKVLLLIHPDSSQADQAIQEIIDAYKKKFDQESVMKVRNSGNVSF